MPGAPPLLAEPRFATISDCERPRMSDPMLVNRVRHPLRPIAPGAAVNPYLLHTDLSLNPFNLFRKSRRQAAQSSRDPLEQEKIAKETEERALTLEKDIKTLTEKLIEKIDRYNKVKDDFGEDVEYLNAIIDSAINRAGNFYRKGNDKDAKNKKRESNLQELKQRLPDMPKNLPALSESHIVSFKGELDKVEEEEHKEGLFDSMRRSESGDISGPHTPYSSASGSEDEYALGEDVSSEKSDENELEEDTDPCPETVHHHYF